MPRCKAWTRVVTDQLRRFIAGFLERCAALYVALTEPPVIPQVRSHRDDDTGLPARCQSDASSVKSMRPPRPRLPPALPQCPCPFVAVLSMPKSNRLHRSTLHALLLVLTLPLVLLCPHTLSTNKRIHKEARRPQLLLRARHVSGHHQHTVALAEVLPVILHG